ncbi:prolipoprotein diacylglyceryl transferase [Blautia sp. HCP3S3_H10_1]|uniref:prolipoprotein diacylglyceryl transferase n=1 Tax=unclassified Blautia TaxID=2648079 RepID=UPI003F8EDE48|nr:prolipoprotein diacylglyceryl transferase [Clostridia bacterium]
MKNELLKIGPFTVYGYGLMIAIGILAAYFTGEARAKKRKLPYEHVFYLVVWCVLGGFLGAKILYWITEWKSIAENPGFLRDTLTDGFVVFGGIIGGIITAYVYCKVEKLDFLRFFDTLMPSVALAQGFGRIGCLLAGCCYGKETSSHLSITFQDSAFAPNGIALIPTQIYSSILDFLHYGLLLLILKRQKKDGETAAAYLIFYSAGRFILEFFRGDLARGSVGVLSTSQFISLFTFAAGVILLVYFAGKRSVKS